MVCRWQALWIEAYSISAKSQLNSNNMALLVCLHTNIHILYMHIWEEGGGVSLVNHIYIYIYNIYCLTLFDNKNMFLYNLEFHESNLSCVEVGLICIYIILLYIRNLFHV